MAVIRSLRHGMARACVARACVALACVAGVACGADPERPPTLFEPLSPSRTGVSFVNRLPEDTAFNILNYLYYYNGGGVAVGDVNNDGLPDLYFTSNLESDRLYLNRGDYRFEDVTETAGVQGPPGWTTGVTMADVNGDGHLDIHVSAVSYLSRRGRNVLYLNDGDGTFTDRTRELGLEFEGYSTQALFFDYDNDGDLDMYLLNYSVHEERGRSAAPQRSPRHPRAGDRLYRNDGTRFTDASDAAGIHGGVEGYGLGIAASDFNADGCLDLFVANDFQENDFLYVNNCDGTFTESIARAMGHTSRFSMGVDAADVNNDGRTDVIVLDMLPAREDVLKTSANAEMFDILELKTRAGYHPQYARNTLQLNRGDGRFSEIGYLAGVFATDWSWSALLADLDNDGLKDLFITNGIYRRPNDLDYIAHVGTDAVQRSLAKGIDRNTLALLERMPHVALPNYAFRNNGDLTFTNRAAEWGLAEPGFSNGAAYADLNNSGALDLVINNVNAPASIYRNRAREGGGAHFLRITLRGARRNTAGVGARVIAKHAGTTQVLEQVPTRGFQSAVDSRLHFGVGAATRVDSLMVIWPGGASEVRTGIPVDTTVTFAEQDARGRYVAAAPPRPVLTTDTAPRGLTWRHRENDVFDFNRDPLVPHMLSREGPALAVGDVNGDGLDDVFLGGAKWQPAALFLQAADGSFRETPQPGIRADSLNEDVDAAFFDADGDRDPDLYVVSGGNEFWGDHPALRDRLYLNDGRGHFTRATAALPPMHENRGCVVPADYDADGDVDLFVGSRVVAREYGRIPRSHLLENDGGGRFRDVTAQVAPGLATVGMVSSAAWLDTDRDGRLELAVAGEWMPVRLFRQRARDGSSGAPLFEDATAAAGLAGTEGWWNSVEAADLNADGRPDLVIGNLGLNSYIKATPGEPARLYVHDFGGTGALKQILTFYKDGVSYPIATRDEIVRQVPSLRGKFPSHASYGASRVEDIFPAAELKAAAVLEARTFATSVALNRGDGTFAMRPLPAEAQFAPVYASLARDFDGDGRTDLLLGGNFSGVTPLRGRYDASYGLLLRGDGAGGFTAVDMTASGVAVPGEIRALELLRTRRGPSVAAARNDDTLVLLTPAVPASATSSLQRGPR